MFGTLMILKGSLTSKSSTSTVAPSLHQEKHIVIPLSTNLPRLPTLHSGSKDHTISNHKHKQMVNNYLLSMLFLNCH